MEYISAEEFLKEDEKVQNVLLDWFNANITKYDLVQDENRIMLYKSFLERGYVENDSYPLFTEGQLRKFIEDKTNKRFDIELCYQENNRQNEYAFFESGYCSTKYDSLGTDLLQAYWKVACEIASKEVNNE